MSENSIQNFPQISYYSHIRLKNSTSIFRRRWFEQNISKQINNKLVNTEMNLHVPTCVHYVTGN